MPTYLEVPHTNNIRAGVPRNLDEEYEINADYQADTTVTVRFQGAQKNSRVTLFSGADQADIEIVSVRAGSAVLLGLVSINRDDEQSMTCKIPAGYKVKLVTSGDAADTATIVNVQENIYANDSQP